MENVLDMYDGSILFEGQTHGKAGHHQGFIQGSSVTLMLTRSSMPFILPGAYFVGVTHNFPNHSFHFIRDDILKYLGFER